MNDKEWKNIDKHMKDLFNNREIKKLKSFPNTKDEINKLSENVLYKATYTTIAVSIIDNENKWNYLDEDDWNRIYYQFVSGISKIMKIYNSKFIKLENETIYCILKSDTKEQINKIIDCCVEINTYKTHINKIIHKWLLDGNNGDEEEIIIDFGIGAWLSFESFVSRIGSEIIPIGDSINNAHFLSTWANTGNYESILANELLIENATNEYKKNNNNVWDFQKHNKLINNEIVLGFNWTFTKYINWIKNNS